MQEFDYELNYIKGKENVVADALSRKHNEVHKPSPSILKHLLNITTIKLNEELLKSLEQEYQEDEIFKEIYDSPREPYYKQGNKLYLDQKLCIPKGNIRKDILNDNHESLFGAHRGYKKTIAQIRRHFYWPQMKKEILEYVKTCTECQKAKSLNTKPFGKLRPFPPPSKKWEEISMDFIFDLPRTSNKNTGILVVVDKLSKQTHFIPLDSKINAKGTADLFYKEVYKQHGLPRKIISDRDSRFTSNFWKELMKLLQVKLNLSTAFHPQTDGQSERAFRILEEMLRCYVNSTQNDWERFLPGLEFAYNNSINESTKHTPFYLAYGQHPVSISDILHTDIVDSENRATTNFLAEIQKATALAKTAIRQAMDSNIIPYNKNRKDLDLQVGDKVLLSTKNLPLKTGKSKKLSPKYIGPFTITERIASGNAYKLELPKHLKNIHPVFNAMVLKPYEKNSRTETNNSESLFQAIPPNREVEKILSDRIKDGDQQFLVHFKNTDATEDMWISKEMSHLNHRQLKEYQDRRFEEALEDEPLF